MEYEELLNIYHSHDTKKCNFTDSMIYVRKTSKNISRLNIYLLYLLYLLWTRKVWRWGGGDKNFGPIINLGFQQFFPSYL